MRAALRPVALIVVVVAIAIGAANALGGRTRASSATVGSSDPTSTTVPAPIVPTGGLDYAAAFTARTGTWAGGDSPQTVRIDDRRRLWLFSDTWMDGGSSLVRNSIVLQDGASFVPVATGPIGARTTPIGSTVAGSWSWPVGGIYDAASSSVWVLSDRMTTRDGASGVWNFRHTGADFTRITIDGDAVRVGATIPGPTADAEWTSVVDRGDVIDIYGNVRHHRDQHVVARVARSMFSSGRWEYWNGRAWTADGTKLAPMVVASSATASFDVVAVADGYIATSLVHDVTSRRVEAWSSSTPNGPWRALGTIAMIDVPPEGRWITYDAKLVPTTEQGWVLVWSQLDAGSTKVAMDPLYGIRVEPVTSPIITSLVPRRP